MDNYWRENLTFDLQISRCVCKLKPVYEFVMAMQAERASQEQEEDQFGPQLISRLEVSDLA
jgi:hypothetical protein